MYWWRRRLLRRSRKVAQGRARPRVTPLLIDCPPARSVEAREAGRACSRHAMKLTDLPPELQESHGSQDASSNWEQGLRAWADQALARGQRGLLDKAVPAFERIMIETALKHTAGRRRDAAELLGWGRNTLTRKIKELGMNGNNSDDDDDGDE